MVYTSGHGGVPWHATVKSAAFETMSKRRRGFPSETHVKRGYRAIVTPLGDKELTEKLGRNDPCPCGSGHKFKRCCLETGRLRWLQPRRLLAVMRPG
jgi:uncharacterized protein YchJ